MTCRSWEWGLCVGIGCPECDPDPHPYPCPTCGGNGCGSCGGTGERIDYATGGPVYDVGGFLRYGRVWISNDSGENEEVR